MAMGEHGSEVSVRQLVASDRDAWLPLWRGHQAFYRVEIAADVTDRTFARLTGGGEPMEGSLAIRDGTAVGLAHVVRHRSTWTSGDYCYLQDLFTADDARGLGFGRALIDHVQQRARELGCARVYWLTHETNAPAIALYDRMAQRSGFIQYRQAL